MDVRTVHALAAAAISALILAQPAFGQPAGTTPSAVKAEVPTVISDLTSRIDLNENIYLPLGGGPMEFAMILPTDHCPKNQAKTKAALVELEKAWAVALAQHDASTVACMLADEFEEADVDGALHTRNEVLEHIPQRKPGSNGLTELRAGIEGNFGYVRGLNEVKDPSGIIRARVRFTDIFIYRDGRWQAILAHESLIGEASR